MKKSLIAASFMVCALIASAVYAVMSTNPRSQEIVEYKPGHMHDESGTHGAPEHSGGTDRYGCHNASVPYHCH